MIALLICRDRSIRIAEVREGADGPERYIVQLARPFPPVLAVLPRDDDPKPIPTVDFALLGVVHRLAVYQER